MSGLRRILVVVDRGMRATPALRRGVELARRASASLHLCLFDHHALIEATADVVDPEVMRLAKAQYLSERQRWVARECESIGMQGLRVDGEVCWAPALHEALIERVVALGPDLVIKDIDADGAHANRWFTPPDWKLLRLCPAPLMLVHPQSAALPQRILATVDTSGEAVRHVALNDAVLRMGNMLALYSDAAVHVAHVFPFRPPVNERLHGLESEYEEMRRADAAQFQAFAQRHGIPAERQRLLAGEPAATLADLARSESFDLLVAGSVYRSAVDRFFLGSTVESLIARIGCDLLVVKPAAFIAELGRHLDLDALRQRQALLQDHDALPVRTMAATR